MKKTVAFYTLGCRVNQYETAAMEDLFKKEGYTIIPFDEMASIYVVNTCAVTQESERKCRQILRRAKKKNPEGIVVGVGCMVQAIQDKLNTLPEVDVFIGVNQKHKIIEAIENVSLKNNYIDDMKGVSCYQEMKISDFNDRDRAFVKIQDGCDNFCSYCIIPYLRGRIRSRAPEDVLDEISLISKKGFQEIVLTGIHVASFGRGTGYNLSDLIRDVAKTDSVSRIRLSSIDVAAFDENLIRTYMETDKLCPQFHISLQSGSDSVLKRMNRHYTSDEYFSVVQKLREIRKNTAVTTDIITGFPGETEAEFAETFEFVEKIRFSDIHVFPYSEREGTRAKDMPNQVPKRLRDERARTLIDKANAMKKMYASGFVGSTQEVLFEHKNDELSGYTPHFLRVIIPDHPSPSSLYGKIRAVEITEMKGALLYGRIK